MTDQERRLNVAAALLLATVVYLVIAGLIGFGGWGSVLVGSFAVCGAGLVMDHRLRG